MFYNYGNAGLNGDGTGDPVPDIIDGLRRHPDRSTIVMSPALWPRGSKVHRADLRHLHPYGHVDRSLFRPVRWTERRILRAMTAWDWDDGQADFAIFEVPAGSTTADNTSTLLDSGFASDIASVNAGENRRTIGTLNNIGQTYTVANGGLTINTGAGGQGPGGQYGSGGTWSLTNVGAIANRRH